MYIYIYTVSHEMCQHDCDLCYNSCNPPPISIKFYAPKQ